MKFVWRGSTRKPSLVSSRDNHSRVAMNFKKIIATREWLSRELTKLGFRVLPRQTNFILAQPPRFPAKDWLQKLRERRILVRWFSAPEVKDYLRVTIGTAAEAKALVKGVRRILHL